MTLAPYVRIVARGQGRARSLTVDEAHAAMTAMFSEEAAPEAIGAILMVLRLRGETTEEIAGFTAAMRAHLNPWSGIGAALDWPSYASGRSRGAPWFMLAARLLAQAGHPVLLHGHNGSDLALRSNLDPLGIPVVKDPAEAHRALAEYQIAYAPLESISPRLFDLLMLRDTLGLRSCANTCLRMLNPSGAKTSVQGVFHPGYRPLQCGAAEILGDPSVMVIKGGGGEFERTPFKSVTLFGGPEGCNFPPAPPLLAVEDGRTPRVADPDILPAIWSGDRSDPVATATVTGTAALALLARGAAHDLTDAQAQANALWADRLTREHTGRAA
ncbi:MAG: glycosyl transferase family protein [Pseudomonadota bacterium]